MKKELKETTVHVDKDINDYFIAVVHNETGSAVGVRASFEELLSIHDLIENMVI